MLSDYKIKLTLLSDANIMRVFHVSTRKSVSYEHTHAPFFLFPSLGRVKWLFSAALSPLLFFVKTTECPYPPSSSWALVVRPASSLQVPFTSSHGKALWQPFWISAHPFALLPTPPSIGECGIFSGLPTWELERWLSPLARLVWPLYMARPAPCCHRAPCSVDSSQGTKQEAEQVHLCFQPSRPLI